LAHSAFPAAQAAHLLNTVRLAAERHPGPRLVLTDAVLAHLPQLTRQAAAARDAELVGALAAALAVCEADGKRVGD